MTRRTEMYPRAWLAHHKLQWGDNWKYVFRLYQPPKEVPMK